MSREPNAIVRGGKYAGKFVAMESFNKRDVVASGLDPIKVRGKATLKGFSSPVIVYCPNKNMYNLF